jgi:hypothetical protein
VEEGVFRNTGRLIRTVKRPMWMSSGDYILPPARTAITGGGDSLHWKAISSAQE